MTEKEYLDCQLRIGRYRDLMGQIDRRNKEAQRWNEMASRPSGSGYHLARGTRAGAQDADDFSQLKINAMAIAEECDHLAELAKEERGRLISAIDCLKDPVDQDLLECAYLNGMTDAKLAEHFAVTPKTARRWRSSAIGRLARSSDYFKKS